MSTEPREMVVNAPIAMSLPPSAEHRVRHAADHIIPISRSCRHEGAFETMSASSFLFRAALPDRDDDCQPDYTCGRCKQPAVNAEAFTLVPWTLTATPVTLSTWLCGACAKQLRRWLGGE